MIRSSILRTRQCRTAVTWPIVLAAAAVLGGVAPGTSPETPAWAAPSPSSEPGKAGEPRTVTLVTGDKVRVSGMRVAVERGRGRQRTTFVVERIRDHVHVIPSDAVRMLQRGRLDPRLFDVTLLAESGYDDRRGRLPLIASYAGGRAAASIRAKGATVARTYPAAGAAAVHVATPDLPEFWQDITAAEATGRDLREPVAKLWLDAIRKPLLDRSVPQVDAPAAWQAGYDGNGVKVAVLDTGIDVSHPDLAGAVIAGANFTDGVEDDRDLVGHGTHVASIVAGRGAASAGRYRGVAPGAKLLNGKVCGYAGCAESWILAGMQWAADQGAKVVNLSVGGADSAELDPLEQAVQTLTDRYGMLFVAAAGNDGTDGSVASPASADAALAVGAVTRTDELAPFSSRGPRVGDGAVKPDMTAPGVGITAARSKDGALGTPGDSYLTFSGTSMATPHVAGAAAILAQRHPGWSPAMLKATLMGTARPNPAVGAYAQGAGRLSVGAAVNQRVTAQPASVSFGRQLWPHDDDRPTTVNVTYHNHGDTAVTLNLSVRTDAPAGVFTAAAQSLTVPAGGDASVTIKADTRTAPSGAVSGYLVAAGGDQLVHTPLGVEVEPEAYDLTLHHRDRAGQPTAAYGTRVVRLDDPAAPSWWPYDADGTAVIRLPKGTYQVGSHMPMTGAEQTLLLQPQVRLDRATTVDIDARRGKPVSVAAPESSARTASTEVLYHAQTAGGAIAVGVLAPTGVQLRTARLGPDRAIDGNLTTVYTVAARPADDGTFDGSPYAYHLAWSVPGRMITGFDRRVTRAELATVRAGHSRAADGGLGMRTVWAHLPGAHLLGLGESLRFALPHRRTEYYTTARGVRWESDFYEFVPDPAGGPRPVADFRSSSTAYERGRQYTESWNSAAFAPCVPPQPPGFPFGLGVRRTGDRIGVAVPLHCDGAGRRGYRFEVTGHTILRRDGAVVGESSRPGQGDFTVPAEDGAYQLDIEAQSGTAHPVSTRTRLAWQFRSRHTAEPTQIALPTLRMSPRLDPDNTAPAGCTFPVPITVDGSAGDLAVEASVDDGTTWRSVPVRDGTAMVTHPGGTGYVSLRATAAGRTGTRVELTLIRAYRIA